MPGAGRPAAGGRFRRRARGAPPLQGRWSLTATAFGSTDAADTEARVRAWAELLLERHGVLTRELVRAEGFPGGFSALYPALAALETLGAARRGYFVEGLGGAQFALPGAVERLRAQQGSSTAPQVLALADPAQLYGAGLRWPAGVRAPARRPGGLVVLVGGTPVLVVEPGGRSLLVLTDQHDAPPVQPALEALVAATREGTTPKLTLEKVDGEPVVGSPWQGRLLALGFRPGLRRLTLGRDA
jgi:ATP-dependent Lhr-like helicase